MFEGLSGGEHRHNLLLAQSQHRPTLRPVAVPFAEGQRCGQNQSWQRNPTSVQTPLSRVLNSAGDASTATVPRGWATARAQARVPRVVSARTFLKMSKSEQCMLQNYCPRVFLWFLTPMIQTPSPQQIFRIEKNKNHCTVSHINEARPLFESKCT